jgi:cytochrome b561
MTPKDRFGIAVRVIGLIVLLLTLLYLTSAALTVMNPRYSPTNITVSYYLLHGTVGLAVGLYLLRGGSRIVRFAYPPKNTSEDAAPEV